MSSDPPGDLAAQRRRGAVAAAPFVLVYALVIAWTVLVDGHALAVVALAPGVAVFTAFVYVLAGPPAPF